MRTKAWANLLIMIAKAEIKVAGGEPKFEMADYHLLVDNIIMPEPNTIYTFATTDVSSIISTAIREVTGGNFNHAGLLTFDHNNRPMVVHMVGKGLVVQDLLEVLRDTDYLCINKLELTEDNYNIACERLDYLLMNRDIMEYDYSQLMDNGDHKFYCSEANFFVLDGLYDDVDLKPELIYGINVFSPDQVTKLGRIVYSNHPIIAGRLENEITT
jgi:hypothetical protein